jgi:3-hydroxybutyryl-CoA dehydrogenase
MGTGIALLAAHHGCTVRVVGRSAAALAGTQRRIAGTLHFLATEGYCDRVAAETATGRVHGSTDMAEALRAARVIIEAVPEDPETKRDVYRAIGAHAPADAIVASTTSGLNVFELAPDFPTPERLLIAHFWNPAYLVPLVEVVPGPRTSAETLRETEALLHAWDRVPVRLREYVPGFVGVRLNAALYREALHLIDTGIVDAPGIDAVMAESVALRFPVLSLMEIADFGGLDTFVRVWQHMFPLISSASDLPAAVRQKVTDGAFGLKSGRGFYDYRGREPDALLRERDRRLLRWLRDRNRYRVGGPEETRIMRTRIAKREFGLRTGAFSHGYCVDVGSALAIYTAGQLAVDADGHIVGGEDAARQAEHIYSVLEGILRDAGASLDDVVKTTAYLTDIRDYPRVNEVRNRVFANREPASTIVEVSKLVHPAAKVEIEAVALRIK